jgi:hypothetical protein
LIEELPAKVAEVKNIVVEEKPFEWTCDRTELKYTFI